MSQITVLTGPERHRRRREDERQTILAAAFAPGASVSEVARRYDVATSLIYKWRQQALSSNCGETSFAPAVVVDGAGLASRGLHRQAFEVFVITEADAAAICATFNQEGELSAAIELRRRFPGMKARACARSIARWMPPPAQPSRVTRLRPRKDI